MYSGRPKINSTTPREDPMVVTLSQPSLLQHCKDECAGVGNTIYRTSLCSLMLVSDESLTSWYPNHV